MVNSADTQKMKTSDVKDAASLLELGLEDLEKSEKSKNIEIDMGTWWSGDTLKGPCSACLAGCVLLNRFPKKITEKIKRGKYDLRYSDIKNLKGKIGVFPLNSALQALDAFKDGEIYDALRYLSIFAPNNIEIYHLKYNTTYDESPELFKRNMREIIKWLKANNL